MITELTEWQRKKVRGIIWNAFASTFEKLFYSSIDRVDDIPKVDDKTFDEEMGLWKKSKRPPIGDARSCMDDDNDF